jgi:His-Xaa-Ser system protein HxsD
MPILKLNFADHSAGATLVNHPIVPIPHMLHTIPGTVNQYMAYRNVINGNEILVYADSRLYAREAIFKCLYWYGDKFHTTVLLENDLFYKISLVPQANQQDAIDKSLYLQKMERDLVDFNLRAIVTKETRNIRDLLIAKAFSNGEFDEDPPGEISDPVGYNVRL